MCSPTENDEFNAMIECAELAGKTVERLRLSRTELGGQELHLEFTDGTAFSLSVEPSTMRSAQLVFQSEGQIETIRNYEE